MNISIYDVTLGGWGGVKRAALTLPKGGLFWVLGYS